MKVKELINRLWYCNPDAEVYLCDDVEFKDEYGTCIRTCYGITEVESHGREARLCFDNSNHFARRKGDE